VITVCRILALLILAAVLVWLAAEGAPEEDSEGDEDGLAQ
jgi:hypothetical protein